jgi:hypothetical protein
LQCRVGHGEIVARQPRRRFPSGMTKPKLAGLGLSA